jgi:LTXXQ motif family protein
MRHLARPFLNTFGAATLFGSVVLVGLPSAVSQAQRADPVVPARTADSAQDADTLSPNTPTQENRAKQPAFDPLEARIKYLHNRLRVTPAQEPLWADLAQVMRENEKSMASVLKERFQGARSGNAIDALGADEKVGEAQLEALKKFTAAFQALYEGLTPDQKKIADVIFRQPQLPEQAAIPSLYAAIPSPYAYYSPAPAYPAYPSYPLYSYYPYYSFLFVGPRIGLRHEFVFHHHPGFVPFPPPVHTGVPPDRAAVIRAPFRPR